MATSSECDAEDFTVPPEVLPDVCIPHQDLVHDGQPLPAMISHIETPNHFYLHLVNSETGAIDSFCDSMLEYYTKECEPLNVKEFPLGSHWAVRTADGSWYRCQIISNLLPEEQDVKSERKVKVRFIDYGNCDKVYIKNIRVLNEIFTLMPILAIPCSLAKVYPQDSWAENPWSLESIEAFQKLCGEPDSVLNAYFVDFKESGRYDVILETWEGAVVNEEMVLNGLAVSSILHQVANEKKLSSEESTQQNKAVSSGLSKSSIVLPTSWNPMESAYRNPTNSVVFNDECAENVFIGFRNTDESRLCKYFRKGLHCPRGDACKWEHTRQYEGMTVEKVETITSCGTPLIPQQGSIVAVCVTHINSPKQFYIQFPFGIKDLRLPDEITDDQPENFATLFEAMSEHYKTALPSLQPTLPTCGELLAYCRKVKNKTESLRVRVLEVDDEYDIPSVKVFLIDIGRTGWVKENELHPLSLEFSHMPPQVTECWLTDTTSRGEWTKEATSYFRELTDNRMLVAYIDQVQEEMQLGVHLYWTDNGQDVDINVALENYIESSEPSS